MFNNEVTYDKKWETKENLAALKVIQKKYFPRSECSPDCPRSWAPEVLELFNKLDKELGICYNESTIRGYRLKGNLFSWFISGPWVDMFTVFKNTLNPPHYWNKSPWVRARQLPRKLISAFFSSFTYGFKAMGPLYINPYLNKFFNKRIRLGQFKEKYGELTVYFSCDEAFREYVDQEVRKCEVKLAMKGAYYPLENFYNAKTSYYVGSKFRPDTISVDKINEDGTVSVSMTTYRKAMQDLGINLEEIAKIAPKKKENDDE